MGGRVGLGALLEALGEFGQTEAGLPDELRRRPKVVLVPIARCRLRLSSPRSRGEEEEEGERPPFRVDAHVQHDPCEGRGGPGRWRERMVAGAGVRMVVRGFGVVCVWGGGLGGCVPVMQAARTDGIGPVSVEVLPKNETHRMKKGMIGTMGKSMSGGATTWMKYAYPSHVIPTPPIGTSIAPYGTSLATRRHREFRECRVFRTASEYAGLCVSLLGGTRLNTSTARKAPANSTRPPAQVPGAGHRKAPRRCR